MARSLFDHLDLPIGTDPTGDGIGQRITRLTHATGAFLIPIQKLAAVRCTSTAFRANYACSVVNENTEFRWS